MKKALIVGLNNYPSCNLHWLLLVSIITPVAISIGVTTTRLQLRALWRPTGMAFDLKTGLHDLVKMKVSIIALWLIKLEIFFKENLI